jgi:hypothetical protein
LFFFLLNERTNERTHCRSPPSAAHRCRVFLVVV